ncbi:response regulator transcription factor [Plantactinospora sp. GCM10030261]|uniref:helix-turn-helix transcriptional regulator n=1 Tax=Plantactinospora sp. GCM10030261 TaxID=3273420 RepID=UPI00362404BE
MIALRSKQRRDALSIGRITDSTWGDGVLTGSVEIAVEIGGIASSIDDLGTRAMALLRCLRRLIRYRAGWVVLFDPVRPGLIPLAVEGRAGGVAPDASAARGEVERLGLDRPGSPRLLRELPVTLHGWAEPEAEGGAEGVVAPLTTTDGRCLGLLIMHTDAQHRPTEQVLNLLGTLTPMAANAADPLRTVMTTARSVPGAWAGVLLAGDGATMALPGLAGHPLLTPPSRVLALAAPAERDRRSHRSFLVPVDGPGAAEHLRVTVIESLADTPYQRGVAVLLGPAGDVHGLTPRELEIAGLLVDGSSNRRIAAALHVTERTVAAHVEHILVKLAASTRTMAALRAHQLGLFVPRTSESCAPGW